MRRENRQSKDTRLLGRTGGRRGRTILMLVPALAGLIAITLAPPPAATEWSAPASPASASAEPSPASSPDPAATEWSPSASPASASAEPSPARSPAPAPADAVYFPETGQVVGGAFRDFWRRRGALDVFGYPGTAAYDHDGVMVQWFQRARFERWPGQPGVTLALLGQEAGVSQRPLPAPRDERALRTAGMRYFPETGHLVGGEILRFFERWGGVEIFGYPLTEEIGLEPDSSGVMQWFQRARLEWRPGAGVQPALLGDELLDRHGLRAGPLAAPQPRPAGAPDWFPALAAGAEQPAPPVRAITPARAPFPIEPGEKWIEIDISEQRVTAWEGNRPVFTDLVSTGKAGKGLTPIGVFRIQRRVANATMDSRTIGIPPGHPLYYRLENVLYTQYFTPQGHAIHYAWWHNNFGQPMSFGCVNMRLATARWFWDWATLGTLVVVRP